jgi:Pentapeptide repeats (8 copies)
VVPNQKLAAERVTPSWKRELTQKEAHELQNSIRQTFMQAIGGAALLLGFFFTAWTLRISQKTLRVTQEGHITERFTKAIEHLGDKEHLMIRLGGIYALERIARDSDKDHWPIMEVLTAYVRDTAPWIPKEAQPLPEGQALVLQSPRMHTPASSTAEGPALRSIPTDIQAILTVIGRRTRSPNREGKYRLDLHNTDLRSANLREAHLEGANLREAYLEGASLAHAHLEGADLREAHLRPD